MKGRKLRKGVLAGMICGLAIALIAGAALLYLRGKRADRQPDVLLAQYMEYLGKGDYSSMYGMLDAESRERVGKEEFLERHQNIYDGIEANNFSDRGNRHGKDRQGGDNGLLPYENGQCRRRDQFRPSGGFHQRQRKGICTLLE